MKIKNIEGLSARDLQKEERKGGRFIYFAFTISLIFVTLKRTSGIYLLRNGENAIIKGLPYTILSVLFGWWGIPVGPKTTLESIRTNLKGGKDVTDEVMATIEGHILFRETQSKKLAHS